MFCKFNWGHGITLFYIVFVGIVAAALIASFGVDHSLVVDDYYATDLAYQSRYDKSKNYIESKILSVSHDTDNQSAIIRFETDQSVRGIAQFYRPSDKSADFNVPLTRSETRVPTGDMLKGKWIVKVEWSIDGRVSYAEEQIFVN